MFWESKRNVSSRSEWVGYAWARDRDFLVSVIDLIIKNDDCHKAAYAERTEKYQKQHIAFQSVNVYIIISISGWKLCCFS